MPKVIPNGHGQVIFENRNQAGRLLAEKLAAYRSDRPVILGLAHGGVVVAYEVAKALKAPLFALNVKKIGAPHDPELAVGARVEEQLWPLPELKNKTVIVIDDGVATGHTAKAAIDFVKQHSPAKFILATPVCAADTAGILSGLADALECLLIPRELTAVGNYYSDFPQVSDEEVTALLTAAKDF